MKNIPINSIPKVLLISAIVGTLTGCGGGGKDSLTSGSSSSDVVSPITEQIIPTSTFDSSNRIAYPVISGVTDKTYEARKISIAVPDSGYVSCTLATNGVGTCSDSVTSGAPGQELPCTWSVDTNGLNGAIYNGLEASANTLYIHIPSTKTSLYFSALAGDVTNNSFLGNGLLFKTGAVSGSLTSKEGARVFFSDTDMSQTRAYYDAASALLPLKPELTVTNSHLTPEAFHNTDIMISNSEYGYQRIVFAADGTFKASRVHNEEVLNAATITELPNSGQWSLANNILSLDFGSTKLSIGVSLVPSMNSGSAVKSGAWQLPLTIGNTTAGDVKVILNPLNALPYAEVFHIRIKY